MKTTMLAALAVIAGVFAGCGDDSASDAPSAAPPDASVGDFCAGIMGVGQAFEGVDGDKPTAEQLDSIQAAAADLGEVGTPEEMSGDERTGFGLVVAFIADADSETTIAELNSPDAGLGGPEQEQFDAFDAFVEDTCFSGSGGDE